MSSLTLFCHPGEGRDQESLLAAQAYNRERFDRATQLGAFQAHAPGVFFWC